MSPVTRGYMTLVVLTTSAVALNLVNPASLLLSWDMVINKFQV